MQFKIALIFSLLSIFSTLNAQSYIAALPYSDNLEVSVEFNESWVLFENTDDKKILIDFESINSTVSDIRIKTATNDIEFSDVVADLPQNVIYELDFSYLTKGNYILEVRTFNEVLTKKISI